MRRVTQALLFFLCTYNLAEAAPCGSPGTMLFYLNGMFNSHIDALKGRNELRKLVLGSLGKVRTELLHNQNEGLLSLLEVAAQRTLPD